jgi:hypothetical protein
MDHLLNNTSFSLHQFFEFIFKVEGVYKSILVAYFFLLDRHNTNSFYLFFKIKNYIYRNYNKYFFNKLRA